MSWVIYTLSDPDTGEVRYVGYTAAQPPEKRLRWHLKPSKLAEDRHVCRWIKSIQDRGLKPMFAIVETGEGDGWKVAERRWIRSFPNLTNHTDGGDGVNLQFAPGAHEARVKISNAAKLRMEDPLQRTNLSEKMKARWADPDTRAKFVQDAIRRASRPDRKEAFVRQNEAQWRDPERKEEWRKRMVAGRTTPTARKRRSEVAKEIASRPEIMEAARLRMAALNADGKLSAPRAAGIKKYFEDPDSMARHKERMKLAWQKVKEAGFPNMRQYKEAFS